MHILSSAGQQAVSDIAQRHGLSVDAVMHMLDAVVRGNGSMAQFSHPEFGGSGQWMRGGMTMVSDLFNYSLKSRVDNLCSELSNLVANQPGLMQAASFQSQTQGAPMPAVSWSAGADTSGAPAPSGNLFAPPPPDWWGPSLRWPNSTGAQNGSRYAYFAQARRLAVETGGNVTIYDTLDHQIGGFSQQQAADGSMSCSSQYGTVAVSSLPIVSINGLPPQSSPGSAWNAPAANQAYPGDLPSLQPASAGGSGSLDVLATVQKLAELHSAGVLTQEEFSAKKAELLARL